MNNQKNQRPETRPFKNKNNKIELNLNNGETLLWNEQMIKDRRIHRGINTIKFQEGINKLTRPYFNLNFKELVFPSTLVKIPEHSFFGCNNLEKVTICGKTVVESNAFYYNKLKIAIVGKDVIIKENAFPPNAKIIIME